MPFYLDKLYFNDEGGLYFMVHGAGDKKLRQRLEAALRLLGENGIGLQRGLGNGQFEHEWATLELDLPAQATAAACLSLYCPTWEEWSPLNLEQSAYNFVKRGGWISAADPEYIRLRKRSVHMLVEGSAMPFAHAGAVILKGNGMIDLTPKTIEPPLPDGMKVWRDGTGVFLPISDS
jgi:CRISPR-associated protein Csm4